MKARFFSVLGVGMFAALVLCIAPAAQASCCGGCNTLVSSSCCNIFGCNCDGPCTNFGCGCPPVASSDYCGVCLGYYTLIYNGACAYTSQSAPSTAAKTATVKKDTVLSLPVATAESRFKLVDTNGNGWISYEETSAWVKKQGGGSRISGTDLRAKFKAVDTNGDGKVQRSEFDSSLK